jgi:hypothetical protein
MILQNQFLQIYQKKNKNLINFYVKRILKQILKIIDLDLSKDLKIISLKLFYKVNKPNSLKVLMGFEYQNNSKSLKFVSKLSLIF